MTSALTGPAMMPQIYDLGADRASDDAADFGDHLLEGSPRLGDESRICGDAIEQAHAGKLADFGNFGRIGKKLHGLPQREWSRASSPMARSNQPGVMAAVEPGRLAQGIDDGPVPAA